MDYSDKNRRTMGEALQSAKLRDEELAFLKGSKPSPAVESGEVLSAVAGSVSMTFRLPAALAAKLVREATERKLNRQRPFTQQDIVAEAIVAWLAAQGHSA
jgi:hypothetical protein